MGFFVNYHIGGRGDFLTHCLRDVETDPSLSRDLNTYAKLPPSTGYNVKIHGSFNGVVTQLENFNNNFNSWTELFNEVNKHKLVKIKIVATTLEEQIDLLWLAHSKVVANNTEHTPVLTMEEVGVPDSRTIHEILDKLATSALKELPNSQNLDNDYLHEYDYIINFEDLFDIDYIKNLYKQIHGKDMGYARHKAIKKNIAMQFRLSKSEFYNIVKNRCEVLKIRMSQ